LVEEIRKTKNTREGDNNGNNPGSNTKIEKKPSKREIDKVGTRSERVKEADRLLRGRDRITAILKKKKGKVPKKGGNKRGKRS